MSSFKPKQSLSKRLQVLKEYGEGATSIWDIGCDHGLLGLSFVDSSNIQEINLVDASAKVIEVLHSNIKDSYITKENLKINILHQNGQDLKILSTKKTVFIAGMGGQEIKDILSALESSLGLEDKVVISPHRKILELRAFLNSSSFRLFDEVVVEENQQFYPILCLVRDQKYPAVSLYGEKPWYSDTGRAYCAHQIKHFSEHQNENSQAYLRYLMELKSLNELS